MHLTHRPVSLDAMQDMHAYDDCDMSRQARAPTLV